MKNGGVCSLQYDLFIPPVDGGRLKSTAPNQCSRTESTDRMMNSQMFSSALCGRERCGKGNGLRRKKLNQLLFHYSFDSSFLLIFTLDLWTKENWIFFIRSSSNQIITQPMWMEIIIKQHPLWFETSLCTPFTSGPADRIDRKDQWRQG